MNNHINKNKISLIFPLLVFIIASLFLCGCGQEKVNDAVTKGYSVTDDFGNKLHFSEKPKRILGTTANIEEILLELVPPERMAAISEQNIDKEISLMPDEAAKVKKVIPNLAPLETIIAQHPDLVFMQIKNNQAAADTLTEMGIRVFRMKTPVTLPMIRDRIHIMSIAVGEIERGNQMLQKLDEKVAEVKKRTGNLPRDKKKIVIGFSSLGASGSATGLFHNICEESGVVNGGAVSGISYAERISDERIVKVNPDIFIIVDEGTANDYGRQTVRKIMDDAALRNVKAVQNQHFIIFKYRYKYSNSQHFGDAVTLIAKGAYPELFEGAKNTSVKVQ